MARRRYSVNNPNLPFELIPEGDRYSRLWNGRLSRVKKPSKQVRQIVFIRDKFTCQICREDFRDKVTSDPYAGDYVPGLELGHLIPYRLGGPYHPLNLQAECTTCNLKKGSR